MSDTMNATPHSPHHMEIDLPTGNRRPSTDNLHRFLSDYTRYGTAPHTLDIERAVAQMAEVISAHFAGARLRWKTVSYISLSKASAQTRPP